MEWVKFRQKNYNPHSLCHSEFLKAVHINYSNSYRMLNEMTENEDEKENAWHSVSVFVEKMCLFEN